MCPRCGGHVINEGAELPEDMRKEARRIAKGLWDGSITEGTIDPVMTKMVAEELRKGVIKGFGKDLPAVDFGTPDYKMLASLEKDVFHFSGAQNYQMLKSMSAALKEGNWFKDFKDFEKEALEITGAYNKHLRTEYETAKASSIMGSKWVDIEKNKSAAPWLRYDTVGDSKVRPTHKALDGVIKKVDDPFWDMYYPPLGWRCRCDVTQLVHGADSGAFLPPDDVPAIFKTNFAKEGLAFPKGHAYYEDMPEGLKEKAAALREPKYSKAYTSSKTGKKVQVSSMADPADLEYNLTHTQRLADLGESSSIRPHITTKDVKNPELEMYKGTQVGDFKEPKPKGNPKNSYEKQIINTGKQGANIPVIVLNDLNYSRVDMIRALSNGELWKNKHIATITELWLMFEGVLVKITREAIERGEFKNLLP
ncbi:phage minor head protein [Niabella sp. 22666]|uniref:phage minor head protein n=1 Tax=Niabella sp. 22666 TaxID=3453954 RepID=UPI003F850A0A